MTPLTSRIGAARVLAAQAFRPGNLLAALVWGFLLYNLLLSTSFPPSLSRILVTIIISTSMLLFLARRDPSRTGSHWEMAVALAGTFIISFLGESSGPRSGFINEIATPVQLVGLAGWAWSLHSLGRSFGLAPADRGLKQDGAYRLIRHPMYASEMIFFLGYFLAVPTLQSALVILIFIGLQIVRLIREERILSGYSEYRSTVRWRLVPLVW